MWHFHYSDEFNTLPRFLKAVETSMQEIFGFYCAWQNFHQTKLQTLEKKQKKMSKLFKLPNANADAVIEPQTTSDGGKWIFNPISDVRRTWSKSTTTSLTLVGSVLGSVKGDWAHRFLEQQEWSGKSLINTSPWVDWVLKFGFIAVLWATVGLTLSGVM